MDGHVASLALERQARVVTSDPGDLSRWGVPPRLWCAADQSGHKVFPRNVLCAGWGLAVGLAWTVGEYGGEAAVLGRAERPRLGHLTDR
ncbi:MAG: hypothetical protein ACRD0K_23845 [Egibacteraceae bacterium]